MKSGIKLLPNFRQWKQRNKDVLKNLYRSVKNEIDYNMLCKICYQEVIRHKRFYSNKAGLYVTPFMQINGKINFAHKVSLYVMDYLTKYDSKNYNDSIQVEVQRILHVSDKISFAIFKTMLFIELDYVNNLLRSLKKSSLFKSLGNKQQKKIIELIKENNVLADTTNFLAEKTKIGKWSYLENNVRLEYNQNGKNARGAINTIITKEKDTDPLIRKSISKSSLETTLNNILKYFNRHNLLMD